MRLRKCLIVKNFDTIKYLQKQKKAVIVLSEKVGNDQQMKKIIPLSKQSKKEQRRYYALKRGSWNGINPVTRKPKNPKAYDRRRAKSFSDAE